jgi:hypothetical protein
MRLRLLYIAVVIALLAAGILLARRSTEVLPNESLTAASERANPDGDRRPASLEEAKTQKPSSVDQAKPETSIRNIDFSNFRYPWPEAKGAQKTFSLKNGELPATRDKKGFIDGMGVEMIGVYYADVTRDNAEEAVVALDVQTGGSALPCIVYIYGLQVSKPKLLWAFWTGDRADEGLRNVYAEQGTLIVELYSSQDSRGDCCPRYYTRTIYQWTGKRFDRKGPVETLPNPDENASSKFQPTRNS